MNIKTCYKILNVEEGSPLFYVTQSYQTLVKQFETEINQAENDQKRYAAENRLKQVQLAYKKIILSGKSSEKIVSPAGATVPPIPSPSPPSAKIVTEQSTPPAAKPAIRLAPQTPAPKPAGIPPLLIIGALLLCVIAVAAYWFRDFIIPGKTLTKSDLESLVSLEHLETMAFEEFTKDLLARQLLAHQQMLEKLFEDRAKKETAKLKTETIRKKTAEPPPSQPPVYDQQQAYANLQRELKRLEQTRKHEVRALLVQAKGRYREVSDGVMVDQETGLMWTLLNSKATLNRCLNFDMATRYVAHLRLAGYSDWRIPSSRELAEIYIRRPVYPAQGADWFWSSEVYLKGWGKNAAIIMPNQAELIENKFADITECGAVHAVRP